MRRHPALRALSSEHHTGLVIARRAGKAAREGGLAQSTAWASVKERFRAELESHFLREELGLLPALRAQGEAGLVERTLREHQALRALITEDRAANLARFAELLAAHIRFEEALLFPAAQSLLGPAQLAALEPSIEAPQEAVGRGAGQHG